MQKFLLFIALFTITSPAAFGYSFSTVYNGYGDVYMADDSVELEPKTALSSDVTHGALVVTNTKYEDDYEISFTVENIEQLRDNSTPNPWEAPWVIFGYKDAKDNEGNDDQTFTYVILKPNGYGLELGESLTDDRQNFLWTSDRGDESYNVGEEYDVTVRVEDGRITVYVDGDEKFSYKNSAKSTLTLDGKVGFYTEDAHVKFSDIKIKSLTDSSSFYTPETTRMPGSSNYNSNNSNRRQSRNYSNNSERLQSVYGVNSKFFTRGLKQRIKLENTNPKRFYEVSVRKEVLDEYTRRQEELHNAYFQLKQVRRPSF